MIPVVDGLSAFGSASVAAVLLTGYLVAGEPVAGHVLHRRFEAALLIQRAARTWLYSRLLILEWGLVALVAGVVLVAPDVGWAELGLRWPNRWPSMLAVVPTLLLLVVLTGSTVASRRVRSPAAGPGTVAAPPSVAALVPRTGTERRLFVPVALSAGFCEEVLYRGFMLAVITALVPGVPDSVLIVVSGVIFGLVHAYQGLSGILTTGVLGGFLTATYVGSGSLLLPILLHAAIDLRILLIPVGLLPTTEGDTG